LTDALWRRLHVAMTPSEAKALIDQWLLAKLEEDADLRDRPPGSAHEVLVFRRTDALTPDLVVNSLTRGEADRLVRQAPPPDYPDDPVFGEFGWSHSGLAGEREFVASDMSDADIARQAFRKPHVEASARLHNGADEVARQLVRVVLEQVGVTVDEAAPAFTAATRFMMRAQADLAEQWRARDLAGWRRWLKDDPAQELVDRLKPGATACLPPAHSSIDHTTVDVATVAFNPSGMSLGQAAAQAIPEIARMERIKPGRVKDYQIAVRTFIEWLGRDPDMAEIDSAMAGRFKLDLTYYPSNVSKRLPYRNLTTFADRLAAAKDAADEQVLHARTINGKYITPIRRVFMWQKSNGHQFGNPFDGILAAKPKQPDPHEERRDFSPSEIRALFNQPLFTGSAGGSHLPLYRPGSHRVSDWRFWVPLICLFTGMRLNEACGLALVDFKTESGIDYIHVRDDEPGQSLKTGSARRKVPIHSELIKVGLVRWVGELRTAGHNRLFHELELNSLEYFSGIPSKFLNRLVRKIADPVPDMPGKLVFHSTRHTVISRLRAAEVRMDVSKDIVGHEQGETHGDYGDSDMLTRKTVT
jgi:integrase